MCFLVSFGALKKPSPSISAWQNLWQESLKDELKSQAFSPKSLLAVLSHAARQSWELGEKLSETLADIFPSASTLTYGQCLDPLGCGVSLCPQEGHGHGQGRGDACG